MIRGTKRMIAATAFVAFAQPLSAGTIADAPGDFLPTYSGPQNGDLDILGASVAFDGTNFLLSSTHAGAIGTSTGSLFVWGIDRGAGFDRLTFGTPSIGAGVPFDAVGVLFPDGLARAVTLATMGPPTINPLPGAVTVSGNTISGVIPAALFPSAGFSPENYVFTLWSRRRENPMMDGTNAEVADFGPSLTATAVPEPEGWAMMILGFGAIGGILRWRRSAFRTSKARAKLDVDPVAA